LWPDPLWPDPLWPDPLWIEVTALQIIADALEAAFARQGWRRLRVNDAGKARKTITPTMLRRPRLIWLAECRNASRSAPWREPLERRHSTWLAFSSGEPARRFIAI